MVLTFESDPCCTRWLSFLNLDEILSVTIQMKATEQYAVLSCGTVYDVAQGGSTF